MTPITIINEHHNYHLINQVRTYLAGRLVTKFWDDDDDKIIKNIIMIFDQGVKQLKSMCPTVSLTDSWLATNRDHPNQ